MRVTAAYAFAIGFGVGFILGLAFGGLFGFLFGALSAGLEVGFFFGLIAGVVTGVVGLVLFFVWRLLSRNQQLMLIAVALALGLFVPGLEFLDAVALVGGALTFTGVKKGTGR